ncbi:MarR family transcriptional regulator [Desulfuromonas carbonis]|uniref:MarR family winged helix-turn-helix transcriptional regulator n=1 Tax=Desulfuromonas sp. DDH964 TaxID=1823759 RepID=UPI00078DED36|nr:MarR family transcriptional regulator [Desulfuromonas sp. DDH964]AMV72950.1 MarR family winged helix-turn-helix transcriptional regulator [Desulfuromonas sp. DDH964]
MDGLNIESSLGFLLAKAHQRIYAQFRDLLAPHGITPAQFALLAFLWQEDGRTQTALSEKTEIDRTTLSGLLDRLQKLGLVHRRPDPADRRAWRVCLTAKGRALEKVLTPVALGVRRQVVAALAPGEYEELCRLLAKIRGSNHD